MTAPPIAFHFDFISPFVIVDGEPFFGVEKLELVEEWLQTGGW